MTEQPEPRPNRTLTGLLIAGVLLIAIGGLGAIGAARAAEQDALAREFAYTFSNLLVDVSPNYTVTILLLVLALIGVVLVISYFVIKAARH